MLETSLISKLYIETM